MTESLHHSPETITTLLISYTPKQNYMFSLKIKKKKERPPETRLKACRSCTQANLPSATPPLSHCCETPHQSLWAWGVVSGHEPAAPPFPQDRNKEIPFYLKKKKCLKPPPPRPPPKYCWTLGYLNSLGLFLHLWDENHDTECMRLV